MNRKEQWAVGEWVRGKTRKGELIHGFVESIDSAGSTVHVYVVNCDNELAVGKVVAASVKWIEAMAESSLEEEQLHDLIDLALATRDRNWFSELAVELQELQKNSSGREKGRLEQRGARNRLGTSAIWE